MIDWDFPDDLPSGSVKNVSVEFDHGANKVWQDDAGEADFLVVEGGELRIGAEHRRGPNRNQPGLYACIKFAGENCPDDDFQTLRFDLDEDGQLFHVVLEGGPGNRMLKKGI